MDMSQVVFNQPSQVLRLLCRMGQAFVES